MSPTPLPPQLVSRLGQQEAVRLVDVVEASPAAKAGLHAGDLLLTVQGKPVTSALELQRHMFADAIGAPLALTVLRNNALVDVIASPTELVG
jgi:S1-C subfamily serine protease